LLSRFPIASDIGWLDSSLCLPDTSQTYHADRISRLSISHAGSYLLPNRLPPVTRYFCCKSINSNESIQPTYLASTVTEITDPLGRNRGPNSWMSIRLCRILELHRQLQCSSHKRCIALLGTDEGGADVGIKLHRTRQKHPHIVYESTAATKPMS
jgi:hypothetical protein